MQETQEVAGLIPGSGRSPGEGNGNICFNKTLKWFSDAQQVCSQPFSFKAEFCIPNWAHTSHHNIQILSKSGQSSYDSLFALSPPCWMSQVLLGAPFFPPLPRLCCFLHWAHLQPYYICLTRVSFNACLKSYLSSEDLHDFRIRGENYLQVHPPPLFL